jgi:hypothetical protein
LGGLALSGAAPLDAFHDPRAVAIAGYAGDAMEPFVSKDGRWLLFNNRNDPPERTDLFYAERRPDGAFVFKGPIAGANSAALDGVASLDDAGELYFISTRSYARTLSSVYRARFADGHASGVELAPGVSPLVPGIVDFDAEISADGQSLYVAEGDFRGDGPKPKTARIVLFERSGDGFRRAPTSDALLAAVNVDGLNYAPDISADGLELYFTRVGKIAPGAEPHILRAVRTDVTAPFAHVARVAGVEGFVEAPSLSGDGRQLYLHRLVGDRFQLWTLQR